MRRGGKEKNEGRGLAWPLIRVFCVLFTLFWLVIAFTPVANLLARPLVAEPSLKKAGLIVVLGGGAFENRVLGSASNERMIRGMLLYKQGYAPRIMFAGGSILNTTVKVLRTATKTADNAAIDVSEAAIMGETYAALGLPQKDVFIDAASTHTRATFLRQRTRWKKTISAHALLCRLRRT